MTQPTISELIRGESRSSTHLPRIARALRTTPEYLMAETDDPSIDAAALAISAADLEWLDLLHSLSPRDRNAVRVLAQTLGGQTQTMIAFEGEPPIQTLQAQRLEYKGSK